jgi:hypothetical protein
MAKTKSIFKSLIRNRTFMRFILAFISLMFLIDFLYNWSPVSFWIGLVMGIVTFIYYESTLTPTEKERRAEKKARERAEREHYQRIKREAYISGREQERGRYTAQRDERIRAEGVRTFNKQKKEFFGDFRYQQTKRKGHEL